MNFRQADEDPFVQAHRAPDRTQPADSAATDVLACALAITWLLIIAVVASGLNPTSAFDILRVLGGAR